MDETRVEGDMATFSCRVTGRPRPSIMWLYLQSPLTTEEPSGMTIPSPLDETSGKYTVNRMDIDQRVAMSSLMVLDVAPSDSGFYVCFAMNVALEGMAAANASLTVQGKRVVVWFCYT